MWSLVQWLFRTHPLPHALRGHLIFFIVFRTTVGMLEFRIELPTTLPSFGPHVRAGIEAQEAYPTSISQENMLVTTQSPREEGMGTLHRVSRPDLP